MDIEETGWEGVDRVHLVQYRDKWRVVMTYLAVQNAGNCLTVNTNLMTSTELVASVIGVFFHT